VLQHILVRQFRGIMAHGLSSLDCVVALTIQQGLGKPFDYRYLPISHGTNVDLT
jgi:hypothetical protein